MVGRVLKIVYREVKGLHQAAYILGLFAFGSQILGLVRDRLLAHQFGAGTELDIYYAAFRVPDVLFVLFASTLSVYVLVPFVSRALEKEGELAGGELLSQVFTVFLVAYSLVALACFWYAPSLVQFLFPGIERQDELVSLMRVLLLQPFFLGMSSLFGVVTQLSSRFVLYAVSPLVYNAGIILGIVAFYPLFGLPGLALGVVVGAIAHLLVQWPFVRASHLRIGLASSFDWSRLRSILALSIPRAFTLSLQQIVLLVLFGLASTMAAGSLSIFQFAFNLQSVPLAVIGVSYSVAAFPQLAALIARNNRQEFVEHIRTALRHIIFWSVPAIALIIILRAQLVRVVLGSGAFDWSDTRLTAAVLALLSVSLLAQAVNLVVIRAFYAGGDTRTPLLVTLAGAAFTLVFAFGFHYFYMIHFDLQSFVVSLMRLDGVGGSEVLALAFGYTMATCLQALGLLFLLKREFSIDLGPVRRSFFEASVAAIMGGLCAYVGLNFLVEGVEQGKFLGIFIQGLLSGILGIAGAVLTYAYLKNAELHEVRASFQKKILKTDVVAPQEEVL